VVLTFAVQKDLFHPLKTNRQKTLENILYILLDGLLKITLLT